MVKLSNHLILCNPLILWPSIFPSIKVFSNELALRIRWPKYWSFSISPFDVYSGFISLGLTGLNSLQSKGLSRVFSSTTIQKHQFFGAQPSFVPTLTSIHDYWKNHSFDYMDLCQQDDVFAFWYIALVFHNFPSKEQTSFNFMAAVIIHSDFGAQENKICHCFYFLLFYLPWNDETRCHDLQFFEYWVLSQVFHSHQEALCFLPLEWYHWHILRNQYLVRRKKGGSIWWSDSVSDKGLKAPKGQFEVWECPGCWGTAGIGEEVGKSFAYFAV